MVKLFPLLQAWKVLGPYLHMQHTEDSKYIIWMLNLHSSILFLIKKSTLNNQKVLLIQTKGTWSANYTKHCMVWNKLLEHGRKGYITTLYRLVFRKKNDNSSLYIKEGLDSKIVLAKIFVDDTLFIGNDDLCKEFSKKMNKEFEMSMFGEIKFFVGLQIQ